MAMNTMDCASNPVEVCEDLLMKDFINMEHLDFVRKEIYKKDDLHLAQQVRAQLIKEIQILSDALLDAEIVIGDKLRELPRRGKKYKNCQVTFIIGPDDRKSKSQVIREVGLTKSEAKRCELLSQEKLLINNMRIEAELKDEIPVVKNIMHCIREKRNMNKKKKVSHLPMDPKSEKIVNRWHFVATNYKDFMNTLLRIKILKRNKQFFSVLSEFYVSETAIEYDIKQIGECINALISIQKFLTLLLQQTEIPTDNNALSIYQAPTFTRGELFEKYRNITQQQRLKTE